MINKSPFIIILKKELKALFLSPAFYVITFFITLIMGITFSIGIYNFAQLASNAMMAMAMQSTQQQNIHYVVFMPHLSVLNLVFMFLIPALCMRLVAEEKKNRTFDLLMTSPVTSLQIVLAKFFSVAFVVFILSLITLLYILLVKLFFDFSLIPTLLASLGIFLVGLVYVSLGLFSSSLTESTVLSFFMGVMFNLSLWILGALSEFVETPILKSILEQLSMNGHLQALIEGVVRTQGLVFFATIIVLFLFISDRLIEASRWRS